MLTAQCLNEETFATSVVVFLSALMNNVPSAFILAPVL